MNLDKLRSNQCLDIMRNVFLVARYRVSSARKELDAVDHRMEGAMDSLKLLIKTMPSPVSGVIRSDSEGDGKFGASRGGRLHYGVDLTCVAGEGVLAPHNGTITREVLPYDGDNHYSGIEIASDLFISHLLYVKPLANTIGDKVEANDLIGTAQDIQKRYGDKMQQHIHWKLMINPVMFLEL